MELKFVDAVPGVQSNRAPGQNRHSVEALAERVGQWAQVFSGKKSQQTKCSNLKRSAEKLGFRLETATRHEGSEYNVYARVTGKL